MEDLLRIDSGIFCFWPKPCWWIFFCLPQILWCKFFFGQIMLVEIFSGPKHSNDGGVMLRVASQIFFFSYEVKVEFFFFLVNLWGNFFFCLCHGPKWLTVAWPI